MTVVFWVWMAVAGVFVWYTITGRLLVRRTTREIQERQRAGWDFANKQALYAALYDKDRVWIRDQLRLCGRPTPQAILNPQVGRPNDIQDPVTRGFADYTVAQLYARERIIAIHRIPPVTFHKES